MQGKQDNGWTAIQFRRLLDTCDPMDVPIRVGHSSEPRVTSENDVHFSLEQISCYSPMDLSVATVTSPIMRTVERQESSPSDPMLILHPTWISTESNRSNFS